MQGWQNGYLCEIVAMAMENSAELRAQEYRTGRPSYLLSITVAQNPFLNQVLLTKEVVAFIMSRFGNATSEWEKDLGGVTSQVLLSYQHVDILTQFIGQCTKPAVTLQKRIGDELFGRQKQMIFPATGLYFVRYPKLRTLQPSLQPLSNVEQEELSKLHPKTRISTPQVNTRVKVIRSKVINISGQNGIVIGTNGINCSVKLDDGRGPFSVAPSNLEILEVPQNGSNQVRLDQSILDQYLLRPCIAFTQKTTLCRNFAGRSAWIESCNIGFRHAHTSQEHLDSIKLFLEEASDPRPPLFRPNERDGDKLLPEITFHSKYDWESFDITNWKDLHLLVSDVRAFESVDSDHVDLRRFLRYYVAFLALKCRLVSKANHKELDAMSEFHSYAELLVGVNSKSIPFLKDHKPEYLPAEIRSRFAELLYHLYFGCARKTNFEKFRDRKTIFN